MVPPRRLFVSHLLKHISHQHTTQHRTVTRKRKTKQILESMEMQVNKQPNLLKKKISTVCMYVECGQWYHPRLVIKANISTLCNHSPQTRGAQISLLCLSLFFSLLSTYNKQTICTPIPPLFLSTPMPHIGKNKTQKEKKKKETKRHVESKRCRFLRGQKGKKKYEPNQKDRKELGQQETIRWGEERKTQWPSSRDGWG